MQQFSHSGADDWHLGLPVFLQSLREFFDNWVMARSDDCGKIEGFANSTVPQFGQIRVLQAGAGFLLARSDAGSGGELASIIVAGEIHLAEQKLGGLFSNAWYGE